VHALLAQGASHGQIMRKLHLSRNTVKKYAEAEHAEQLIRGPKYSTTLVDPFRDYLRHRRAQEPAVPTWTLLGEIKAMGYQGGSTLLYRYLAQGRADDVDPPPSPRRLASWIATDPAKLTASRQTRLDHALKRCPELQTAADHVRSFAALLTADHDGNLQTHPHAWTPGSARSATTRHCLRCAPSPKDCSSTTTPWPPRSPCPTATAPPKASSTRSKH
jgi:hypothetical protein